MSELGDGLTSHQFDALGGKGLVAARAKEPAVAGLAQTSFLHLILWLTNYLLYLTLLMR
jgi:hypothetical protein